MGFFDFLNWNKPLPQQPSMPPVQASPSGNQNYTVQLDLRGNPNPPPPAQCCPQYTIFPWLPRPSPTYTMRGVRVVDPRFNLVSPQLEQRLLPMPYSRDIVVPDERFEFYQGPQWEKPRNR